MDIRRLGFLLFAFAYALAIYGHNTFGMTLATVASVIGAVGFLAGWRWSTTGMAVGAGASALLTIAYLTALSPPTAIAMGLITLGFTGLAFGMNRMNANMQLSGAILVFVANLRFVWSNIITDWSGVFAFVNIAFAFGAAAFAWHAWAMRTDTGTGDNASMDA